MPISPDELGKRCFSWPESEILERLFAGIDYKLQGAQPGRKEYRVTMTDSMCYFYVRKRDVFDELVRVYKKMGWSEVTVSESEGELIFKV